MVSPVIGLFSIFDACYVDWDRIVFNQEPVIGNMLDTLSRMYYTKIILAM